MYSDTFTTSNKYIKYRIKVVETSNDPTNNRTKVKVTVEAWRTNTGYETYGAGTCYVSINGGNYSAKITSSQKITYNSYTQLFSWEDWISHNPDGSKTITVASYIEHATFSSNSQSDTFTLTSYPRQAIITAAADFTDEDNPTITYSNPAGEVVTSLQACIASSDGLNVIVPYRDISKTGTSYTFNLTEAERESLWEASKEYGNYPIRFYLKTVIGANTYYASMPKTLRIVNCSPVVNPEAIDTGGYSTPLTGDNNKLIKGFNYVNVKANATARKKATIIEQRIVCGDQVINGGSGGFSNVETGTITFSVTDSRYITTNKTVTMELIPYIKLTCNMAVDMPTPAGTTTVTISGNYWAGNFGAQNNTLAVYFRYKEKDGDYSDWVTAAASAANDKYTAEIPITGLDYKKAYTFQAKAVDKVITLETKEKTVKTTPVYDWGENDLQFNVPVKDMLGGIINNGLAEYDGGNIDVNETLSHLCLAQYNTPNDSLYYVMTFFYGAKTVTTNRTQIAVPYIYDISQVKSDIYIRQYVNGEWNDWVKQSNVDKMYPIGSIYMSVNNVNPGTLFGGEWEQIKDRFLLSAGDTYAAGATGGHANTVRDITGVSGTGYGGITKSNSPAYVNRVLVTTADYANGTSSMKTFKQYGLDFLPPYLTVYMWKRIA